MVEATVEVATVVATAGARVGRVARWVGTEAAVAVDLLVVEVASVVRLWGLAVA